jgi:hypothetical protein
MRTAMFGRILASRTGHANPRQRPITTV